MSKVLAVLQELKECSYYWSDYDVPIGIHERIDEAIAELELTCDQLIKIWWGGCDARARLTQPEQALITQREPALLERELLKRILDTQHTLSVQIGYEIQELLAQPETDKLTKACRK